MAAVQSKMVPLGTKASEFRLLDTISEKYLSLSELKSESATVIMFICNHCPYVKLIYHHLAIIAADYSKKGISFIAINSNNYRVYTDDAPDKMKELAENLKFTFPYLLDETQEVAKDYQAECTPDFFVYDYSLSLVYRGQYDNARPNNGVEVTGKDLIAALDSILNDQPVAAVQIPALGCNIKWL